MKRTISIFIFAAMMLSVAISAMASDCYYYDSYGEHAYYQESFSYPTCTKPGYVVVKCSACGKTVKEETGDAYGHDWYKAAEKAATCTEQGYVYYCCDECYEEKVTTTKALGHKYKVVQVIKEATCVAAGEEKVKCTRCNHTTVRETAKTKHVYGEWQIITAATDSAKGRRARYCTHCNAEQAEEYYPEGTLYRGVNDKQAAKALQTMLTDCGYLNDSIDGIFGKKTEQAVKDFQTKAGVAVDGIAWPQTNRLLEREWQILKGIYVEDDESLANEVPCCARIEDENGAVEFVYCADHMVLMDAVNILFTPEDTEQMYIDAMLLVRQMYQEELDMICDEWLQSSTEEDQASVIGAQAMFTGYLNASEDVWNRQYGENSAETLELVNEMLHDRIVELCGLLELLSEE